MADGGCLTIEVAYATPAIQRLVVIELPEGASVGDAVDRVLASHPEFAAAANLPVGVWGRVVDAGTPLRDGDRVEFYRPLLLEPREARRRYAAAGVTMNAPHGTGNGG